MSYAYAERPWNTQRFIGLGAAVALNVGLIAALSNGLNFRIELPRYSEPPQLIPIEPVEQKPPQPVDLPILRPDGAANPDELPMPRPDIRIAQDAPPPPEGTQQARRDEGSGSTPSLPVIREVRVDPNFLSKPFYPPSDIRLNHEGTVTLLILVTPDGRASQVKGHKSSGWPGLDNSAMREAMHKWRFIPQTENGIAVSAWGRYSIRYHLD